MCKDTKMNAFWGSSTAQVIHLVSRETLGARGAEMSNYYDTFIQTADDSPASAGTVPAPKGGRKTVALIQYELLTGNPYTHTQEEVLFETYLRHKGLEPNDNPIALAYQQGLYKAGLPVIVFSTGDIHEEHARLTGLGVVFRKPPTQTDVGIETVFEDTCGNLIQLYQL